MIPKPKRFRKFTEYGPSDVLHKGDRVCHHLESQGIPNEGDNGCEGEDILKRRRKGRDYREYGIVARVRGEKGHPGFQDVWVDFVGFGNDSSVLKLRRKPYRLHYYNTSLQKLGDDE